MYLFTDIEFSPSDMHFIASVTRRIVLWNKQRMLSEKNDNSVSEIAEPHETGSTQPGNTETSEKTQTIYRLPVLQHDRRQRTKSCHQNTVFLIQWRYKL
jgi:hypothetical protein